MSFCRCLNGNDTATNFKRWIRLMNGSIGDSSSKRESLGAPAGSEGSRLIRAVPARPAFKQRELAVKQSCQLDT